MLYVYIRVYFSVCITCIICARAYVCKYSVNVQSTCVCENVDVACVPLSTIQVIREHHSQITPSPTLLLHFHCRGVADQVYSLSLFVIVCVRCVWPDIKLFVLYRSSQFSRGCVALIELRDLLRGIYVVELLHCYDCWPFFQEREREIFSIDESYR